MPGVKVNGLKEIILNYLGGPSLIMWAPKDISQAGVRQVAEEESRRGDERTQSMRI